MDFENDVFLSYAHIDDQALAEGEKGWITCLHHALQVRLGQLLGKDPKIWRDEQKLAGNDPFADHLIDRVPRVAAFVSVLSPRYVKSEWCQRELQTFVGACQEAGMARPAGKLRVFKVVKTPVPLDSHPAPLKPVLGYEFYTIEACSGRARELHVPAAKDIEQRYYDKLEDLAHDIAALLGTLEAEATGQPARPVPQPGVCVYLAETSYELRERRDSIRRELQAHGYTVLPEQPLPLVGPDFTAAVREQLARCRLSVHIIGQNYGVVPDGATDSIVVLQHQLALERSAGGDFCRLIWMPPDLAPEDERQKRFVDRLETDPGNGSRTGDLLKTSIEDFKSVLHVRLTPPRPAAAAEPAPAAGAVVDSARSHNFLICDKGDLDAIGPLQDLLFDRGVEVICPCFDGDEASIRRDYEENLADCDAALVYYGAGSPLWLRNKLRELQKIAGYGRTKPLLAKAVYIAPPDTPEKGRFRTLEAIVIRPGAGPTAEALEPFLSRLR